MVLALLGMMVWMYQKNIRNRTYDTSDSPYVYGLPKHYLTGSGPWLGNQPGDADGFEMEYNELPVADDTSGVDDEDAFSVNNTVLDSGSAVNVFLPDIETVDGYYTVQVPVSNTKAGDLLAGWIDFDGNQQYDPYEKATALAKAGEQLLQLTWKLPVGLQSCFTYARFRICAALYAAQLTDATTDINTGEVEDYCVRLVKHWPAQIARRVYANFEQFNEWNGFDSSMMALNRLQLDSVAIRFTSSGTQPEIIGINSLHEASICGLRIGHDSLDITPENPYVYTMAFAKPVQSLSFRLLDIDGGDRVRVTGYYNGKQRDFIVKNLNENYYYQYNKEKQEIFACDFIDSGNELLTPSSLDGGAEFYFEGFTDSVVLHYTDDAVSSSGTFTLAAVSSRWHGLQPIVLTQFTATEVQAGVQLQWQYQPNSNVTACQLSKSDDALSYEVIKTVAMQPAQNTTTLLDEPLAYGQTGCYYRLKIIEKDGFVSYSQPLHYSRKQAPGITGFTFLYQYFNERLILKSLRDFEGPQQLKIYDYQGKYIRSIMLPAMKTNQLVSLENLGDLEQGASYFELTYLGVKYTIEAFRGRE